MASATKKINLIRERKKTKVGHKRKASIKTKGTTKSAEELFAETK